MNERNTFLIYMVGGTIIVYIATRFMSWAAYSLSFLPYGEIDSVSNVAALVYSIGCFILLARGGYTNA